MQGVEQGPDCGRVPAISVVPAHVTITHISELGCAFDMTVHEALGGPNRAFRIETAVERAVRAFPEVQHTEQHERPIHEHDPEQHRVHDARERKRERQHLVHGVRARSSFKMASRRATIASTPAGSSAG